MKKEKIKVLFVCIHNSARSQMAEAFLKKYAPEKFDVESAGLEPRKLNPLAVEAMKEMDIDISGNKVKSVFDLFKTEKKYDFVITVCDESSGEKCPVFPGKSVRLNWDFDDPSALKGSSEEKLIKTRMIRDLIKEKITQFINVIN
ncbi:MAG: arsenate reductase ArsC [Spirochaetes bacterium]|nr:arsenate reductase ArsC [Spirochaetota bacterium]